jgi:hypothetical protein
MAIPTAAPNTQRLSAGSATKRRSRGYGTIPTLPWRVTRSYPRDADRQPALAHLAEVRATPSAPHTMRLLRNGARVQVQARDDAVSGLQTRALADARCVG